MVNHSWRQWLNRVRATRASRRRRIKREERRPLIRSPAEVLEARLMLSATQLVFQPRPPSTAAAGQSLSAPVKVLVEDQSGDVVTTDNSAVTLTLTGGTFASGSNTVTVQASAGVATFSSLVLNASDLAGSYTLTAADSNFAGTISSSILVSPAPLSANPVDIWGETTPNAFTDGLAIFEDIVLGGKAQASVIQGFFPGATSQQVQNALSQLNQSYQSGAFDMWGEATPNAFTDGSTIFEDILLGGKAQASDIQGFFPGATSEETQTALAGLARLDPINPDQLVFQPVPMTGTAGIALGPSVTVAVEDQYGNVVTTDNSTVTLSVGAGPGSFAGPSTITAQAVNGIATFNNVVLDTAGSYTLSASDGSLTGATSGNIVVSPTNASKLVFQTVPGSGAAGNALSPSVTVEVEDQFSNVVTSDGSMVTLAVASGPGGFDSSSTVSVPAVNGVATFSNLLLDTGGTYTLGASDGGLSPATSPTITLYTTNSWINSNGGNWSNPSNWSADRVPGQYDNVLIDVPGNPTIQYDQGTTSINSLVSDDPLSIVGGSLWVANTVQVNNTFTLAGGTLSHALILPGTSGQALILTSSGGTLDGVTMNANLDATDTNGGSPPFNTAGATVLDGLTLIGTAYLGDASGATSGGLYFANTGTLSGTGSVVFGKNLAAANDLGVSSSATLTIGPGITIRGSSGMIEGAFGGTVINQGTISADDSGAQNGSFSYDTDFSSGTMVATAAPIDTSAVTNPAPQAVYQTEREMDGIYTLPNLTPGGAYTVRLDFAELDVNAPGKLMNVSINGTQVLTNFDIFATAGGMYKAIAETFPATANSSGQIVITFATVIGSTHEASINGIELFSGTTRVLAIDAGQLAGGTITIDPTSFINQGVVQAISTETLYISNVTNSAGASISATGNLLSLNGAWTNAAGASITATGGYLDLGDQSSTSTNSWSNAGTITATNATVNLGGLFTFAGLGTLNRTGSTVNLVGTLNNTGATLALGPTTGSWYLVGGTVMGGTLTETAGAELIISSTIGKLDGVTVDGNLDLTQFVGAYLDIKDGLTLNGTAFVGDGTGATSGGLYFLGAQSLSGNGTVVFGKNSDNFLQALNSPSAFTLTIGPGITIRGSSGTIDDALGDTIVNQGTINADDSGGAAGSFVYDTDFSGGYTELTSAVIDTSAVTNPAPQTVYQTERSGDPTYTLPNLTPGGTYTVRLDFAELDASAAGQKLMNVSINGTQVLTNFDIFATAGGMYKAVAETFTATANSYGQIVISFSSATGSSYAASVNGIELFSGNTPILAIDAGLLAGGTITIDPTEFINQGTLEVANGETLDVDDLSGNVGVATLSGSGSNLLLSGNGYTVNQGLTAAAGETLDLYGTWTNAAGSTISANGATLGLFGPWTNAAGAVITVTGGTFDVGDQSASSTNAWSNAGTITASNATVNLGGLFTVAALATINQTADTTNLVGTLNNSGTTLALGPASGSWNLLGGEIQGGTVAETGSAELIMTASGGTLDGVTVDGNLDLTEFSDAFANISDGLTLNGTASLGNASGTTYGQLLFTNAETLGGTGTVLFGTCQFESNELEAQGSSATFTIGPGITIHGSTGTIAGASGAGDTIVNQGTISADLSAGGAISINPANTAYFLNQGTLEVSNGESLDLVGLNGNLGIATLSGTGSTLSLSGSYYQRGYTVDQGLIVTAGQTLSLNGFWTNAVGSTISASGATLNLGDQSSRSLNTWSNAGTISASNSTVNLGGSFTNAGMGTMNLTADIINLIGGLTNTGTTLTLAAGTGSWNLLGGQISGGTLTETGGTELVMTASGGTLGGLTVNGNLDLTEVNDAFALVTGGLTLNGTAYLGDASGATYGQLRFTSTGTLSGTGTIVFGEYPASTFPDGNLLSAVTPPSKFFPTITLTIGSGITIRGSSGAIVGGASDTVINQGTISADDSGGAAGSFVYDTDFSGGVTEATVSAIDTSAVTNPAPQSVYQTERSGNSTYTIPNLTPDGMYTVRLDFAELDANAAGQKLMNVSINGTQVLTNFDIFATAGGMYKAVGQTFPATTNGNGQIVIAFSAAVGSSDPASVNGIELFSGSTPVLAINAGLLAGGTITINPTVYANNPSSFTNQGTLQVSNGEAIDLNNFSPNSGVIHVGAGSILDVTGNLTNASSGSIVIDIGGTSASQYGQLEVSGTATLGGTLQVDLVDGFSPAVGNTFEIMTFSSAVGTFSSVLDWPYNVAYDPSDLTLSL
jgi:hypothetical protein